MSQTEPIYRTADLCDAHDERLRLCEPIFSDYGGRRLFHGPVATVTTLDDNTKLKALAESAGKGRVMVVDGGGSLARALIGGDIAAIAAGNGWAGVVIHGAVRDRHELAEVDLGIKALALCPRRPRQHDIGETGVPVTFAGITINQGDYLYADPDGIAVAEGKLDI